MEKNRTEISYPLSFRESDARLLGEHLKHRHSVDVVGMKRVGISNFLRYFLYHEGVKKAFIGEERHLFIPVDLNDLVERELYPFWTLTFKRVVDEVEQSDLPKEIQLKVAASFLASIQTNDLFLLIDGLRRSLSLLVGEGILPTLFLLRFDRIKDAVTPELFDNLQGLRDATDNKLAYVFTSFRSLDMLSPRAFSKAALSAFSHLMYLKPASASDMKIIADVSLQRYRLELEAGVESELLRLVGGNVQYLQLALVILHEQREKKTIKKDELFSLLVQDERVTLYSEELWESLTLAEREASIRASSGEVVEGEVRKNAPYIFDMGIIQGETKNLHLFSLLFTQYVLQIQDQSTRKEKELVFSKKEHLLFTFLQARIGQICERDEIIEAVWPEYKEFGVSDWSIDRLVARVRQKLKQQVNPYEIKTVRTRGYMLIERI